MRHIVILLSLVLAACSSNDEGDGPPDITLPLPQYVQAVLTGFVRAGTTAGQTVPLALVPGVAAAQGFEITPGGGPNSYQCRLPLDTDGNGSKETVIEATVNLNGSLFS